jgi:hypothetical protein
MLVTVVAAVSAAEEARQRLPHRYQRLRYPVRTALLMAAGNLAPTAGCHDKANRSEFAIPMLSRSFISGYAEAEEGHP